MVKDNIVRKGVFYLVAGYDLDSENRIIGKSAKILSSGWLYSNINPNSKFADVKIEVANEKKADWEQNLIGALSLGDWDGIKENPPAQ